MEFVHTSVDDKLATVRLERGKVHALNDQVVEELHTTFKNIENDASVDAVILTGTGKFFSFGFDIPGFMNHSPEAFTAFVTRFTNLCTYLFLFPKPIIAAVNGHAIAGGCLLAITADYRLMVSGKPRMALNEVTFGSSIFAGSVEMLAFCAGKRNAELILTTGKMYSAEEMQNMAIIDRISTDENLMDDARTFAFKYASKEYQAFVSLKNLLRKPVADKINDREKESIREFIKIWYLPATREYLKKIEIR